MKELTEMTVDELLQRQQELAAEIPAEERDAMSTEQIEQRANDLEAVKKELEARKQAAEKLEEIRKEVASDTGKKPIAIFEEGEKKAMNYDIKSPEYRDMWIRNLQGNLTPEERDLYNSGNTNAVPTLIADKFFEKMKKLAPMLSEITLLRVAGNLKFVAEGTRNTATKHTENSVMTPSEDATVSVTLGGFEFMKLIQISRTAKMMSIDAFEGWLVEMLAGDIARAIDNYILNDATNGVAAITYTTGGNAKNMIVESTYTYKTICDLIALLPAAYDAEAKFLVNKKTLYTKIANIVDSSKRPIFVQDSAEGIPGRIMGYPVVVDDYVTSANDAIYLGKWTDVVGNLSEDVHVDVDESAGFSANAIMYRGIAVFDSKPAKTDAIVRLVSTTA